MGEPRECRGLLHWSVSVDYTGNVLLIAPLLSDVPIDWTFGQVFIHGTSRHTHVVAVVVVAAGCSVISHDHISAEILEEMKHAALEAQLRHFEIPLAIHVLVPGQSDSDEAFTVENGGLTQTCKLCRPKLRARFETILQDLFLQTAKVDAKVDEDRASGLVTLLGKVLQNGVTLTSKDEEQWAESVHSLDISQVYASCSRVVRKTDLDGTPFGLCCQLTSFESIFTSMFPWMRCCTSRAIMAVIFTTLCP